MEMNPRIITRITPLINQMKLLWRKIPLDFILIMGITVLLGFQPIVSVYISKLILDILGEAVFAAREGSDFSFLPLLLLILLQFGVGFAGRIVSSVLSYRKQISSQRLSLSLSEGIYWKLDRVPFASFENPDFLNMLSLANSQISRTPLQIVDNVSAIVRSSITMAGMVGILATQHWLSIIPAVILSVPTFLLEKKFAKRRYELEKGRAEKRRKSSYYQSILSSKYFAAEMTFYRFRKKITSRLLKLKKLFIAQDMRIFRKKILLQQPVSMIGNTAYYAYYVVVAAGIAAGRYSLGDFALFTGAFSSVQGSMGQIMGAFGQIYEHNLFVKNYYDFLSYPEESAGSQIAVPPVLTGRKEKIVFDSVRFTYPGTDKEVLKGISLAIREGEKAALVGENGSGKTTLIKLLLGFYDAYEGGIYLDGKELRTWDKEELYLQYGAVFQDFQPYYLSAAENVWIAAGDRVMDDEAAAEALVRSGADFAFGLPNGLRTPLGRFFAGSAELSRGQWHKLANARCFIRNAPVFIMDEPSASLDPKSEYELYRNFAEYCEGRTSILISHRLSNVNTCGRIFCLDSGELSESGSHRELVAAGNGYAELYGKQKAGYV